MFFQSVALITAVGLLVIISSRQNALSKGKSFYNVDGRDGFKEFIENTLELYVYLKKVLRFCIKLVRQYTFHFSVRVLYYVKLFWDSLYSKARDKFLDDAVKDKKTVSRFWDYLKDYKHEKEKEQK
jgi:hypothetical protein